MLHDFPGHYEDNSPRHVSTGTVYTGSHVSTVVVSVRVPRGLKEEAERLGIDIRRVVEESLRRAVEEEKKRRLAEALAGVVRAASGLDPGDWVEAVKEARRGREKPW